MDSELHPKMYVYKRIVHAKLYIDEHYFEKIDLDLISDQAHFSKYHFLRLFKDAFGMSPHQYLTEVRLKNAIVLLKKGIPIHEVCFKIGFESMPSFSSLFKKNNGMSPTKFVAHFKKQNQLKTSSPFSFIPNCYVQSYGWNE